MATKRIVFLELIWLGKCLYGAHDEQRNDTCGYHRNDGCLYNLAGRV